MATRRGVWVVALALGLAAGASAGEEFEGKLTFEVVSKQAGAQPVAMDYTVKKGLVRMDTKVAGMSNYTIIDPAHKKMSMVMPAQKMVMEMAIGSVEPPAPATAPEIVKTDKTERVTFNVVDATTLTLVKEGEAAGAGAKTYEGQQYAVKVGDRNSEQWIAKDLTLLAGFVETFKAMAQGPNAAWMKRVEWPGFPYRMVTKDAEGNVLSEMTLVAIDTKSPDDTLFTVPDDYKKMTMPQAPPAMPKE